MALGIYFDVKGMSAEKYDEVMARLAAAGQANPSGRIYHAAFGSPEALQVFDVWATPEEFETFGQTLMPLLAELGIDPGQPMVSPLHNAVMG